MRLFVAAELPAEMLEALSETSAALRSTVRGRYVAPDRFHVTLAFLGEVPGSLVADVISAVEQGCEGHASMYASLGALGSFGRARSATLWQSINTGDSLPALARDVRESLRVKGFSMDEKSFLAHVTLMRAADLSQAVLPMPVVEKGAINTVTVFKSDLSGPHPVYTPLERILLEDVEPVSF